ncbi:glycosyltransferase [bacterium]|nr:glycosyltransferase [bacterium]
MRVAVVVAHHMPEIGYQDVYLPRAFARIGHQVRVFTSTRINLSGRHLIKEEYPPGLSRNEEYGYEIYRIRNTIELRSNVVAFGLSKFLRDYEPEIVVIIGLGKMFTAAALSTKIYEKSKVILIVGDAAEYAGRDRSTFLNRGLASLRALSFAVLKKRLYHKSVNLCHRIVLNLPETDSIFQSYLNPSQLEAFHSRKIQLSLGYDPDEYYFNVGERVVGRQELDVAQDELLVITATRVAPIKKLERLIDLVSSLNHDGIKLKYLMIGFLGDSYDRELKKYIEQQKNPSIFYCYPFLERNEIRKFYSAADLGIWIKAAISIQEAMGTGLPVFLEKKPVVEHLLEDGVNGWYYHPDEFRPAFYQVIRELSAETVDRRESRRKNLAALNDKNYSYDRIAQRMIQSVAA